MFFLLCLLGQVVKPPNPSYPWFGTDSDSGYSASSFTVTNHSSLFDMVPHSVRRDVTVREVFGWTVRQPFSEAPSPLAFAVKTMSAEPQS